MRTTRTLLHGGTRHAVTADSDSSLLDALRGALGGRIAPRGCANGLCGACRVLVEGEPENACVTRFGAVPDGARVETYEDVARDPAAVAAVAAFTEERPTRCTLCVPCIGVTAVALARQGRRAAAEAEAATTEEAIEATLATAACMCTGRGSMRRALARSLVPSR